jgi:hypothetical protein
MGTVTRPIVPTRLCSASAGISNSSSCLQAPGGSSRATLPRVGRNPPRHHYLAAPRFTGIKTGYGARPAMSRGMVDTATIPARRWRGGSHPRERFHDNGHTGAVWATRPRSTRDSGVSTQRSYRARLRAILSFGRSPTSHPSHRPTRRLPERPQT